ncbi:flagellar hook-basal body complex protein [Sphingomonas sp. So64.6b]|uniref:flagellar hook protein FlgE n=1 Tax=Sphingomonas sp. So64.6b TaxID=2997354 RepID=UPI001601EE27|nr:flagellar hook-basal body complex protein [Sphingomonas sp. So64.6b]QNA82935.1 flagellar hook-basal body complex protein [Sphingomonas sp. So64.6b]
MFGSIYIGLSGLNAYSRGLQQISNNITNLNSQGFRSSTVSFRDSFGVRSRSVSYTGNNNGSGHGVELADSQLNFSQGELRKTDRDLDLAIDGSGMLTLLDGDKILYTRTGSFEVNGDGYIVLAGTDYRLATLDSSGRPVSLSVDVAQTSPPKATTAITFAGNLSTTGTEHPVNDIKVYDASGKQYVWKAAFAKSATVVDQWTVTVTDAAGATVGTQILKFSQGNVDPATTTLTIGNGTTGPTVALKFTGVTSFSTGLTSDLKASKVDGYSLGTATSILINSTGQLEIGYTNQQRKQLGSIAIADFRNPQALTQRSGGLFSDDGMAQRELMASGDPRAGTVKSRQLEASNVDLSKEFGDLILIQRGFQASSQIISVTNDMIQQLFGIRGQG